MKEVLLEYGKGILGIVSVIAMYSLLNQWFGMNGELSKIVNGYMNSLGG